MRQMPSSIIPLLEAMKKLDASDLHLKTGIPPTYRVGGELRKTDIPTIPSDSRIIEKLMEEIIPQKRMHFYEDRGSLDFAHMLPDGDRFRVNVLRAGGHMHAAIRRVKGDIPDFNELHLPPIYKKLAEETNEGLILVCGVTGCGKSTTMAAMVDHINITKCAHIISIEDPVEYAFKP